MNRAFSARTSLLQAASKRAPIARPAGLNLQQQRFAHKVGISMIVWMVVLCASVRVASVAPEARYRIPPKSFKQLANVTCVL